MRKTGLENIKIKSRFLPVPSETGAFGGPDQRNSKPFGSHFVGSRAISLRGRMPDPCTRGRSRAKSGPRQTFRTERGFLNGAPASQSVRRPGKPLFLRGIAKPVLLYTMINGGMRSEGTPKEKWGFIGRFPILRPVHARGECVGGSPPDAEGCGFAHGCPDRKAFRSVSAERTFFPGCRMHRKAGRWKIGLIFCRGGAALSCGAGFSRNRDGAPCCPRKIIRPADRGRAAETKPAGK